MQTDWSSALSLLGREALRIVLPSWCVACDEPLPWRDRVASCCGDCWRSLPRITGAKCRSCALPLSTSAAEPICIGCSTDPAPLEWCECWGIYRGGLERLLHAFKFQRHEFLDEPLAGLMVESLLGRGDTDFDWVAPVPMHARKRRRRGYNQAELVGRALAARLGLRFRSDALECVSERETQSSLPRTARAENVRGSYRAGEGVRGLSILLVDDICTTGQTLRACARELMAGGAARVCAVAVAKAV